MNTPSIETHVPLQVHIPEEPRELAVGRPDIPPPSLWKGSVKVRTAHTHRWGAGKEAVVVRVDHSTNMFRAFYPDEGPIDDTTGKPVGRFAERTEWEHCRDWTVEVTFSPKELERQAARMKLESEIALLDKTSLAAVSILCDDADPVKALAKLEALRQLGIVKASSEAAQVVIAETTKKGGK